MWLMDSLWSLHCSYLGTQSWMWAITTTYTPLLNQTSLLMEETSRITGQLGDSAMENLPQTILVFISFIFLPQNQHLIKYPIFITHIPTRIWSLFAAENLGFTSYPPAYLNLKAKGKNLLNGANFASAASGYYEATAKLYVNTFEAYNSKTLIWKFFGAL